MRPSTAVLLALAPAALSLAVVSLSACSPRRQPAGQRASPPASRSPLTLEHDFGVVPHGERRVHEFELDLARLGEPFVPLRVHLECSCGRADVRFRKADGSERFVDGSGYARNLPADGEQAILHVELDTQKREAVDLPTSQSHGYVLLQPVTDTTGMARIRWPFVLRFGVDAPVELRPFSALDFGRIAESQDGVVLTTLRGDDAHGDMTFGDVRTTDPNLDVTLEPADGHTVVRARCRPAGPGNHRAVVSIGTSLPGYRVNLQATWKVVPDLEATPLAKVSLTAPLDRPQPPEAGQLQFVLVTDHDTSRSPEFVVQQIVGPAGSDAAPHFAVSLSPVPGQERQQRLAVRYLGGLESSFRGTIVLGKPGAAAAGALAATLPIELVVFPSKQP